jgi:hypothetical protein
VAQSSWCLASRASERGVFCGDKERCLLAYHGAIPVCFWLRPSNAPQRSTEKRTFRVTHPYHPLFERQFELITRRRNWGEDRVWFEDGEGRLQTLPTSWTDAGGVDRFVAVAAGRSLFRVAELIELALQIEGLKLESVARGVKEKTPRS